MHDDGLDAAAGIIYWAVKQDSSLADIKENRIKIGMLENWIIALENGLDKLAVKIDGLKEDISLIKTAVLKQRAIFSYKLLIYNY